MHRAVSARMTACLCMLVGITAAVVLVPTTAVASQICDFDCPRDWVPSRNRQWRSCSPRCHIVDCCDDLRKTCKLVKCPANFSRDRHADTTSCSPRCEVGSCCTDDRKSCSSFPCPAGTERDPRKRGNSCSPRCDPMDCCRKANPTCDTFACVPDSHLRDNAQQTRCAASVCTASECCIVNPTCSVSFVCPPHFVNRLSQQGHVDVTTEFCARKFCTAAECCVRASSCDGFQCSDGFEPRKCGSGSGSCHSGRVMCKGAECEPDECCVQAPPPPPPVPCLLRSGAVGVCVADIDCTGVSRLSPTCSASSASNVCCVTSITTERDDGSGKGVNHVVDLCQFESGLRGMCKSSKNCHGHIEHNRCPSHAASVKCCVDNESDELNATNDGVYREDDDNQCAAFCAKQSAHPSLTLACTDACVFGGAVRDDNVADVDISNACSFAEPVNDESTTERQHQRVHLMTLAGCAFRRAFEAPPVVDADIDGAATAVCDEHCGRATATASATSNQLYFGVCSQVCRRTAVKYTTAAAVVDCGRVCKNMQMDGDKACHQACGFAAGILRRRVVAQVLNQEVRPSR